VSEDSLSDAALASPIIRGGTRLVGVIGWPIEHSVSPPMHNAAFAALGLDWCYVPFAVRPLHLAEAVEGIKALGMRGVNVTVPHKQRLLRLVDELSPTARAIGAVNTVVIEEGTLIGHNTDARGFLRALGEQGFSTEGCSALLLGAGGAGRAVAHALVSVGARLVILNRTPARAHSLAAEYADIDERASLRAGLLDRETLGHEAPRAQLVVNATPQGTWPNVDTSPWPEDVPFPSQALLFDLVYNPRETRLMRQARAAGASAVGGLRMLVHQGAEAFEMWTGVRPPIEVMYAACATVLGGD